MSGTDDGHKKEEKNQLIRIGGGGGIKHMCVCGHSYFLRTVALVAKQEHISAKH